MPLNRKTAIVSYWAVAVLTFGPAYNHYAEIWASVENGCRVSPLNGPFAHLVGGAVASAGWPLYWITWIF